jgi:GT2 family glycosyltransferase
MPESPLVSVVIPTFNRAHLLGRTIESVLAQTYPHVELVVVDDGSTDGTADVIARAHGRDPRIRYFRKENGGPASARNLGFREARGAYVALLDSDDTWAPWKLSLQIRCMERNPDLGMTWTDMEMVDPEGRTVDPAYLRHMYASYRWFDDAQLFTRAVPLREIAPDLADVVGGAMLRTGTIFPQIVMGNLVHTSTTVLRRDRLERVRGFDESLRYSGEDYDFHLRTCREGPVGLLDLATIRYQQGLPDRLTAPRYGVHLAENMLRTIGPIIAADHARLGLPERMLRHRLADAYAWAGYEHLELGETDRARARYLTSLRWSPWQPRLAKQLLFAALPFGLGVLLRRRLQAMKARLRRPSADVGAGR